MHRRIRTTFAVSTLGLFVFSAGSSSLLAQRTPDLRVNTGATGAVVSTDSPALAAVGQSVYCVWADRRNGGSDDIYFNRSTNAGATWDGADKRLNTNPVGSADSRKPQIAVSNQSIYVVWEDLRNGTPDIYFQRSLNGGATWLPSDVRLDTSSVGNSFEPAIAAAGSAVYVAWNDSRNPFNREVYLNRSLNNGTSFLGETAVGGVPGLARAVQIAASGTSVHLVWIEDLSGLVDPILANSSNDQGATFNGVAALNLVNLDLFSQEPRIAVSGSVVHAIWWGFDLDGDSNVYYNRSVNNGLTWMPSSVEVDNAPAGARSERASLAVSAGNVYVVWQDTRNGFDDVFFNRSADGGRTWQPSDTRLDSSAPGSAFSGFPMLAAFGTLVYAVWEDLRDGGVDVRYNRSLDAGANWLATDLRLDSGDVAGSSDSNVPVIAASGPAAYVVYQDERNATFGQGDIYFNVPFALLPYGVGKAGSGNFVPVAVGGGRPTVGGSVSIDLSQGLGEAAGVWLLGVGLGSKADLAFFGGTILVMPTPSMPLISIPFMLDGNPGTPGVGTTSLPIAIPASEGLVGLELNFQGFVIDAGGASGFALSNGVEMVIG